MLYKCMESKTRIGKLTVALTLKLGAYFLPYDDAAKMAIVEINSGFVEHFKNLQFLVDMFRRLLKPCKL